MPIIRKFMDWQSPLLPQVVADLRGSHTVLGSCDLTNVVAVFPGREAGRRFQYLLSSATRGQCSPPDVITVGRLPEMFYRPKLKFASETTQILAWSRALQETPPDQLQVVIKRLPERQNLDAWMTLGKLLARQHRELAADQMDFGDVASRGAQVHGFDETERWAVLREVQQRYLHILDGLQLWDQQTARLVAIDRQECRTSKEILLIGTVDMNRTLRSMLAQLAGPVVSYVHAPKSLSKRFDEFGCLKPDQWTQSTIDVRPEQLRIADRPIEQAEAVAKVIAEFNGKYAADEILIGAPDEQVVPFIQRTLDRWDIPTRWAIDRKLSATEPYRLLAAVAAYLSTEEVPEFTALVRHPAVYDWLRRTGLPFDWMIHLDGYVGEHFPLRLNEFLGEGRATSVVRQVATAVHQLLQPLRAERPLHQWVEPLRELLLAVYEGVEFDREARADAQILESCQQIDDVIVLLKEIPEELAPAAKAPQAMQLVLNQVAGNILGSEQNPQAIQISGWLELPLDDSPAVVITSVNEGWIPTSLSHDLFLPNQLRSVLGLEDDARRFARDSYALQSILQSREQVCLIVGRHDHLGEPLFPSRLLFTSDAPTIAQRLITFYAQSDAPARLPLSNSPPMKQLGLAIPRPQPRAEQPRTFRVTEFADYLDSPYRYYLRYVANLCAQRDDAPEIDPPTFGNVLHHVLKEFGRSPVQHSQDPDQIQRFIDKSLDAYVARQFGRQPLFPVRLQIEQGRLRLYDFAHWQADWRAQGWEIRYAEVNPREPVPFPLADGKLIYLRGRIDRIDYHPVRKEWAIFDYKTSEKGASPEKAHRKSGCWVDVQLPLYRHLALPLGVTGSVKLGYILLPRDRSAVGESFAEWSEDELLEADEVARETAQDILDELFWVPLDKRPDRMWEMGPICQLGVAESEVVL